jgi:hypothetical protein
MTNTSKYVIFMVCIVKLAEVGGPLTSSLIANPLIAG